MLFQRELLSDIFEDVLPLALKHHEEVSFNKDLPLDPNFEIYIDLEIKGIVQMFTARDEQTSELVGYAVFFNQNSMHNKSLKCAIQDVIFITPERRGFGSEFIAWCDDQLKLSGINTVYQHVKHSHNHGQMLERQGYELVDLIYGKRL